MSSCHPLVFAGYYLYIESSSPRRNGDGAVIASSKYLRPTSGACVTFWYHMLGKDIGQLVVSVAEVGAKPR